MNQSSIFDLLIDSNSFNLSGVWSKALFDANDDTTTDVGPSLKKSSISLSL